MHASIGRQQHRGHCAVFAGPVKQNLLILLREGIREIGLTYILVHTTRRIAEEKTFKPLSPNGFVYGRISKILFIQVEISRSPAENRLNDVVAILNGPPDLPCQQIHPAQ